MRPTRNFPLLVGLLFGFCLLSGGASDGGTQAKRGGGLYINWDWPPVIAFDIYNVDIDLSILNNPQTSNVLFFSTQLFCGTPMARTTFYFGLQTNVQGRGKGCLFSRWGTKDLANTRVAGTSDSWSVSSPTEGGFVGIRRLLNWTTHRYCLRIRSLAGQDDKIGRWFGFWVYDYNTGVETYVGALRFPKDPSGRYPCIMTEGFGSFVEHANPVNSPLNVPLWDLAVGRPTANAGGYKATKGNWWYAAPADAWQNSDIWADGKTIRLRMGLNTQRIHPPWGIVY